jgi:hypothetical protein
MGDVYRNGKQNLVYLGEDDDGLAERAMKAVQFVYDEASAETDNFALFYHTLYEEIKPKWLSWKQREFGPAPDMEALDSLFGRPWFRYDCSLPRCAIY